MPFAGAITSCSILLLLLVPCAKATPEGFMIEQILSEKGCGAFAGLVATTAGVGEVFRSFLEKEVETPDVFDVFGEKRARKAGLTIFCPNDEAVAAFVPRFKNLSADAQVALLLYHALPSRRSEEALRLIDGKVPTLDKGPWPGSQYRWPRRYRGTFFAVVVGCCCHQDGRRPRPPRCLHHRRRGDSDRAGDRIRSLACLLWGPGVVRDGALEVILSRL